MQFDPDGFFGKSIFKKVNSFLKGKKRFFKLVEFEETYRSLVDAILAFVIPEVKPLIFSYYSGESKKKAKDTFSKEQIQVLDEVVYNVLSALYNGRTLSLDFLKETYNLATIGKEIS
jgi:uracil DNA glycosylase